MMEKRMVEEFQKEDRAVWFLGTHTAMPVKGRVVSICGDDRAGGYAKVDYIYDDSVVFGAEKVHVSCLYESKDDLLAAVCKHVLDRTAEIKAAVRTKDDCIRFMFSQCMDWTARRAIQQIAKKQWGLELN